LPDNLPPARLIELIARYAAIPNGPGQPPPDYCAAIIAEAEARLAVLSGREVA
jgi:hypothetical protein